VTEHYKAVKAYETDTEYFIYDTIDPGDVTHDCEKMGCTNVAIMGHSVDLHVVCRVPKGINLFVTWACKTLDDEFGGSLEENLPELMQSLREKHQEK